MSSKKNTIFRVLFYNQQSLYEIYAKNVSASNLLGFVEVEEFVFNTKSQIVVDPSEARLQAEFENVKRTYLPMALVIRIDEVEKLGTAKITDIQGKTKENNITVFPPSSYTTTRN